jgi:hypothetical protein
MRRITAEIIRAFEGRYELRIDNSRTDGQSLWLFGNKIAEWRSDGLWVSNGGWNSVTTKERLNGLRGVHIRKQGGIWFLNDRVWDGRWVNVNDWNHGVVSGTQAEQVAEEPEFDTTSEWNDLGYSEPVFSVFHSNQVSDLGAVEAKLSEAGILSRRMESDTTGVYRPNYFIVVFPNEHDRALNLLNQ